MKFMVTWSIPPASYREAVSRFLATGAVPPAGVKSLGRYHAVDISSGFHLLEADDPTVLYEHAAKWGDVLTIRIVPVLEDEAIAKVLTTIYSQ